jgi:small GTP-binding protein
MIAEKELASHKVVVIGDSSVGKTSIIHIFDRQTFNPSCHATVGASFLSREVDTTRGRIILNIWDTAGQERYKSLIPTYAHGARAAFLVFDVTAPRSLDNLAGWIESLQRFCAPECALFVVGNKIDLGEQLPREAARCWAARVNAECHFTSALTGAGVKELFAGLAEVLAALEPSDVAGKLIENTTRDSCC